MLLLGCHVTLTLTPTPTLTQILSPTPTTVRVYIPTPTAAQLVRAALAESIDKMRAMPPGPFEVEPPPGIQA